MCGIAGIIDFRGRPIDRAQLDRFNDCLAHRGPDDRGIFVHQQDGFSAGLAHTRLAVIDPTPEAHQPMLDRGQRHVLTYNGELYNFRSLRKRLPAACRTQSDTEVVLEALVAWGPGALARFDGMWALAFVAMDERAGLLSRDPMGIKPLYYALHDHRLVFASELRALQTVPGLPLEIDQDALDLYLQLGFIPHPHTIYRHVRKLPPGHVLRFDAHGAREPEPWKIFRPPDAAAGDVPLPAPDYAAAVQQVRRLAMAAVERQRVADVPLGAFLSGGLDSSVVVACLAQHGTSPIKTFSIGYADHARYDETRYARLVAERFGTQHQAFTLTFDDVLATIEPALARLGEPFADSSLLPTMLVSRLARDHVTVALSGDGGDELFGGYWRYLAHGYLDRYQRLPALLRRGLIAPLLRWAPAARSNRLMDRFRQARKLLRAAGAVDALDRHIAWARWTDPETAAALLGAERAQQAAMRLDGLYRSAANFVTPAPALTQTASPPPVAVGTPTPRHALQSVLLADLAIGLPADMLHKVDLASMTYALEVRVPLLALDLVAYVTHLPLEYKIHRGVGKRILRDAFRDLLPDAVLRRRKMGFEVPIGEFLRHELREMYHDLVTADALGALGLAPAAAAQMYRDHLARREDHADALWSLLVLCHWHRAAQRRG